MVVFTYIVICRIQLTRSQGGSLKVIDDNDDDNDNSLFMALYVLLS